MINKFRRGSIKVVFHILDILLGKTVSVLDALIIIAGLVSVSSIKEALIVLIVLFSVLFLEEAYAAYRKKTGQSL